MFLGAGWVAGWLAGWLDGWLAGWLAGSHPLETLHCTGVVGAAQVLGTLYHTFSAFWL